MSKMPETSCEAKAEKTEKSMRNDYARIVFAFVELGEANYDDVAKFLKLEDRNVVSRRVKEMREMGLLENTGRKTLTSRGRNAFVHKLTGTVLPKIKPKPPTIKTENVIHVREHTRSKKIIEPEKKEKYLF